MKERIGPFNYEEAKKLMSGKDPIFETSPSNSNGTGGKDDSTTQPTVIIVKDVLFGH